MLLTYAWEQSIGGRWEMRQLGTEAYVNFQLSIYYPVRRLITPLGRALSWWCEGWLPSGTGGQTSTMIIKVQPI